MIRLIMSLLGGGSSLPWLIGGVIAIIGGFFGWLAIHDNDVWKKATEAFNKQQEQVYQQKAEEFKQQTEVINNNADTIKNDTDQKNKDALAQLKEIEKNAMAENKDPDKTQASPYLKNIVKQLGATYSEKKK